MGRNLFFIGFGLLSCLRIWGLTILFSTSRLDACLIGGFELVALCCGTANLCLTKKRDYRLIGLAIPACYALGVFIIPPVSRSLSAYSTILIFSSFALWLWALLAMRQRFTIASATWHSLCDWGPYKFVRHPQLTARLLMLGSYIFLIGDLFDYLRLVLAVLLVFVIWQVEETFCEESAGEYLAYQRRVRDAFIPGVV